MKVGCWTKSKAEAGVQLLLSLNVLLSQLQMSVDNSQCILMLVKMVVLKESNIFWNGTHCTKFESHCATKCLIISSFIALIKTFTQHKDISFIDIYILPLLHLYSYVFQ